MKNFSDFSDHNDDDLHLIASSEDLYIVNFCPHEVIIRTYKIYKLDFERMEWDNVNLIIKDQILFDVKSQVVVGLWLKA